MRNKFMKKAAAVIITAAVAVSVLPNTGLTGVSAKASYVRLHTSFKTLKAGQTYKLKLKNNTLGWKITKAVSKDDRVCKAVNKKTYVKLAAKKEGRVTIRVTLKTAKRKGANAVKKLSCRVNVKPLKTAANPDTQAVPEEQAVRTDITVASQEELDKALLCREYKKITLETNASGVFTIASGTYTNADFIVNAPNADVENHAVFKSVTIQDIKENTWKEYAKGNFIKILDEKAGFVADAAASVKEITYAGAGSGAALKLDIHGTVERIAFQTAVKAAVTIAETASVSDIRCLAQQAEVKLDVKGTAGSVVLEAGAALEITGSPKEAVAVMVSESAKGAQVKSSAKIEITLKADASIRLEKGAEGSRAEVTVKEITVSITNKTGTAVELKQPDGTVRKITVNVTVTVKNGQTVTSGTPGTGNMPWTGPSGGSSSGGSSIPEIDLSGITTSLSGTVIISGTSIKPGVLMHEIDGEVHSCGVVTEGALKLTIKGLPKGVEIEDIQDENELENYGIENYYKAGDTLAVHKMFPVRMHAASGKDIEIYFDVTLNKDKWVSLDGVITPSDWSVTQLTKEEAEEILNPKA